MVNTMILFLQTTCVIPQAILLVRGRDKVLPQRYFNLGRFGVFINATAVAWVVFLDVVYCFPTVLPVNKQNMSYVTVVVTGLILFVVVLWLSTKKSTFKGPQINVALMNERRQAALEVQRHGIVETHRPASAKAEG